MKILVIAHYQNDKSPTASFIHSQVKAIAQLGHEVLVIVPVPFGKSDYHNRRISSLIHREDIDGISHVFVRYLSLSRFGQKNFNARSAICAISGSVIARIKWFNPDIIHAHTVGFDSDIGKWVRRKTGKKLVVTIHGSDLDIPLRTGKEAVIKRKLEDVDTVVTISKKLQRNVQTLYPPDKIITIINGCNVEMCIPQEKQRHSILFVGNLIEQKNADIVIRAFAEIKKSYDDARLVIIGKGPMESDLKQLCNRLSIDAFVEFTGQIPNEKVLRCMSSSEYFMMPSVNEGFGIVYIESMACGCITFGTKNEGIADFIKHRVDGILVDPNENSIIREFKYCEDDGDFRKRISNNAVASAGELSWESNARKNIRIYEKLVYGNEERAV